MCTSIQYIPHVQYKYISSCHRFYALSSFPTFLGFPPKLLPPLPTFLSSAVGANENWCSVIYGFGCSGMVRTFMGIPAVMKPHSNTDVNAEWLLWSHSAEQSGD